MSLRDSFTSDEWFKVMTGPGRAGAVVVAASPSGLTGIVAETQAIAAAVRESVSAQGRTPLMEAMAADLLGKPPTPPAQEQARTVEDVRIQSLEAVRQAVWLVSAKTSPEDAEAYRTMLVRVAERTASAAKEGGFLGFGGEQVNDKERAAIEELKRVIGGNTQTLPEQPATLIHETPPGTPER
ncbi:hypothetical protein [Deinococcus sp. Leaf326]|uniref:hypothetical protein n=1 Tax=Deinococcus sp. Leaf326 TaxID=1736338 RepID=UPI0006FB8525|nr:hypothetical protein [Deinococcus sp. Leaf326]KQR27777.1 hypothetical protein ASF71_03990 [Deinococcus sp. Leaf326]